MSLKLRLTEPKILTAPGVFDALTAAIATAAGFEALYLSGLPSPTPSSVGPISAWYQCPRLPRPSPWCGTGLPHR